MFSRQPFLLNIQAALSEGGCTKVHVVLAPPHGSEVRERYPELPAFWNAHPEGGMLSSLQVGLRELSQERSLTGLVVALIDHPGVDFSTIGALIDAHRMGKYRVIRPRFEGRHGHPFLIARDAFRAFIDATLPEGPRPVIRRLRPRLSIDVLDRAILRDVDTPERLRAITSQR